jgi:hypothetical protein
MMNEKRVNVVLVCSLALVVVYLIWAAVGSSRCATTGITEQAWTSWSVMKGCTVDSRFQQE